MTLIASKSVYDSNLVRTPFAGVLLGYIAACLLAPLSFVAYGDVSELDPFLRKVDLGFFGFALFIAVLCLVPFAVLRWILSRSIPIRAWKHALAGAVLGGGLSAAAFGDLSFSVILSANGALCGLAAFVVEARSRRMRLAWMLNVIEANPGWKNELMSELDQACRDPELRGRITANRA